MAPAPFFAVDCKNGHLNPLSNRRQWQVAERTVVEPKKTRASLDTKHHPTDLRGPSRPASGRNPGRLWIEQVDAVSPASSESALCLAALRMPAHPLQGLCMTHGLFWCDTVMYLAISPRRHMSLRAIVSVAAIFLGLRGAYRQHHVIGYARYGGKT
jgi:hypothetical protein